MWGALAALVRGVVAGIGQIIFNANRMIRNLGRREAEVDQLKQESDDREKFTEARDDAVARAAALLQRHRDQRDKSNRKV